MQDSGFFAVGEREVLQPLAADMSIERNATLLYVSISTIETHRRNIMEELEIFTVAKLTKACHP